jgi:hypothetical protein
MEGRAPVVTGHDQRTPVEGGRRDGRPVTIEHIANPRLEVGGGVLERRRIG